MTVGDRGVRGVGIFAILYKNTLFLMRDVYYIIYSYRNLLTPLSPSYPHK